MEQCGENDLATICKLEKREKRWILHSVGVR